MPALKESIKALDALDKKDIQEVRSFTNPPNLVLLTMDAVLLLLGEKAGWES